MTVPGIGPLISTAMVAAIGTGEAFDRGRDFGAWLGLVPRQYSTGGKPILGRISKRGEPLSSNALHSSGAYHLDAAPQLGTLQFRVLAGGGVAPYAQEQTGRSAGQQARTDRLERSQERQGVRPKPGRGERDLDRAEFTLVRDRDD